MEVLTSEETQWAITTAPKATSSVKCRICNRTGHIASACPTKNRRPTTSIPRAPAVTAEAEMEAATYLEEATEAAADDGYYHEVLEDYDAEVECSTVEPAEKRRADASPAHHEALKRLRGPGRPTRQLSAGEGPSTAFPPPPSRPATTAPRPTAPTAPPATAPWRPACPTLPQLTPQRQPPTQPP